MPPKWLAEPVVQYGFVGTTAVLLIILVWMIWKLLDLLKDNQKVIQKNAEAITQCMGEMIAVGKQMKDEHDKLFANQRDLLGLERSLHDKIIARPCIAKGE